MASRWDGMFARGVSVRVYGLAAVVLGLEGLAWKDFAAMAEPEADGASGRMALAYAIALVTLVAGLSMQWRRAAAMLLTAMFVVFGLLVHAPTLFSAPHVHFNWAENALNFALVGSAWVMAASLPAHWTAGRRGV